MPSRLLCVARLAASRSRACVMCGWLVSTTLILPVSVFLWLLSTGHLQRDAHVPRFHFCLHHVLLGEEVGDTLELVQQQRHARVFDLHHL